MHVGGRVLDGSALAALAEGSIYVRGWLAISAKTGMTVLVPGWALAEARNMRPEAAGLLDIFAAHPEVYVVPDPDPIMRRSIDALHDELGVWDPAAAWVALEASARSWAIISGDGDRLRRLVPGVDVDALP